MRSILVVIILQRRQITWKWKETKFSFSRFTLYEEYEYDYEYDPTLPLDEVSYEIKTDD